MTARRAITIVASCTILFGLIGTGVGLGLGNFVPNYYRSICIDGRQEGFDPIDFGVSMGLTKGAFGGALIGLVVVVLLCWREIRLHRNLNPLASGEERSVTSRSLTRRILLNCGFLFSLASCLAVGASLGSMAGSYGAYHRQYLAESKTLAPTIAFDPAFKDVLVMEDTAHGGVFLTGWVSTSADKERLLKIVAREIGEPRTQDVCNGVFVKER
jgi:hypothetical protein